MYPQKCLYIYEDESPQYFAHTHIQAHKYAHIQAHTHKCTGTHTHTKKDQPNINK